MGCNSIEMETATFFNAANVANIKATVIFSVSNNTLTRKSLYTGRTEEYQNRRDKVKEEIIPEIVLKSLNAL